MARIFFGSLLQTHLILSFVPFKQYQENFVKQTPQKVKEHWFLLLWAKQDGPGSCCKILGDEIILVEWLTGWEYHIFSLSSKIYYLSILECEKTHLDYCMVKFRVWDFAYKVNFTITVRVNIAIVSSDLSNYWKKHFPLSFSSLHHFVQAMTNSLFSCNESNNNKTTKMVSSSLF